MLTSKPTLIVVMLIIGVGSGFCEESSLQPTKDKATERILREAKAEHNAGVAARRAGLPLLKKRLQDEKKTERREDIVRSLGGTEDAQAIDPLLEVLKNANESLRVRQVSAESLYKLYRPGLASDKKLNASDKQKILTPMKELYSKEQGKLKCSLASNLYQMGEKKTVRLGILECLKAGKWDTLNTFIYRRKADGVMIQESLPGENEAPKFDEDAHEILKETSGVGYPEEIRVKAAGMLVKLGDKDMAFKAAKDIFENGKINEYRYDALHLMPKIGNAEAKALLENTLKNPKFKDSAERILKWEWGK